MSFVKPLKRPTPFAVFSLLCVSWALAGCATAVPQRPMRFRDDLVKHEGAPRTTPVALMAAYKGSPDDSFIVHHFGEQSGRYFANRVIVYDAKDAGDRVLVVMDEAAIAFNGGLFNSERRITLKGFVKAPNSEPVRIEATSIAYERLPPLGYISLGGGWALTAFSILTGLVGVPYIPLLSYVAGSELRGNYAQILSNSVQGAIDRVSTGVLADFLVEAWKRVEDAPKDAPATVDAPPAEPHAEVKEPAAAAAAPDDKVEKAPVEMGPAKKAPAGKAPAEKAPAEKAPAEKAPVDKAPAEKAPAEKAPAEKAPAEKAPAEKAPVDKAPAEKAPAEKAPAEKAAAEKAPAEKAPAASAEPAAASHVDAGRP